MDVLPEDKKAVVFTENNSRLTADMPIHIIGPLQIKIISCHRSIIPAKYIISEHEHPYYELSFMITGSMETRCDASRITSGEKENRIFLMPPATRHERVFGPASTNINETMIVMISGVGPNGQLASQLLPELIAKHGYSFEFTQALKEISNLYGQILEQNNPALDLARELLQSFLNVFFISNFPELFIENQPLTFTGEFQRDRITAIKNAVDYCINCNKPLNFCEKLLNKSLRQLNRIFKAETGISLFQYQTRCKLDIAEAMLSSSHIPVRDIALSLGFASPEVFAIFFKKHREVSPSVFRKAAIPPR